MNEYQVLDSIIITCITADGLFCDRLKLGSLTAGLANTKTDIAKTALISTRLVGHITTLSNHFVTCLVWWF